MRMFLVTVDWEREKIKERATRLEGFLGGKVAIEKEKTRA
jgi:hypothetical protein